MACAFFVSEPEEPLIEEPHDRRQRSLPASAFPRQIGAPPSPQSGKAFSEVHHPEKLLLLALLAKLGVVAILGAAFFVEPDCLEGSRVGPRDADLCPGRGDPQLPDAFERSLAVDWFAFRGDVVEA